MKVAMLGTWHVHTAEYTESILNSGLSKLAAVWDKDEQKGREYAEKYGCVYYSDLDELLANKDIDSVAVCTATSEHHDVIIKAAKAGKNIFTEKVLAFTLKEALEMKEVIDASGVKFTISFPHLTFPTLRFAKSIFDSGELGTITYARVRNVHNGASAGWLPDTFYDKAQCGGGAMMDLGAHPMYTLNWLLGMPKNIVSTFTSVTGKAVEDNAVSVIEFGGGAIGVSETGFVSQDNPYTLELSGTKGALMVHGDDVTYCCGETGGQWTEANLPEKIKLPIYQWIDAVVNDTDAPFGTDGAVALTMLMEGAYKSFDLGTKYIF